MSRVILNESTRGEMSSRRSTSGLRFATSRYTARDAAFSYFITHAEVALLAGCVNPIGMVDRRQITAVKHG